MLTAILLTRVYALWDRYRIILWSLLAYYAGFAGFAAVRYPLGSTTYSQSTISQWAITRGKPQTVPLVPTTSLGCISALSKDEYVRNYCS